MTTYYVSNIDGAGTSGSNSNNGLSPTAPKLTLNAVEDIPVVAGDTVILQGSSIFRETLTCDVSGSSGNPITYRGDTTGEYFGDGGGPAVISGSDDDTSGSRTNCIAGASRNYRSFYGIDFEAGTGQLIASLGTNCLFEDCTGDSTDQGWIFTGASGVARNCVAFGTDRSGTAIEMGNNSLVESCTLVNYSWCTVLSSGSEIRNSLLLSADFGMVNFGTGLTGSNRVFVRGNRFFNCSPCFSGANDGSVLMEYNQALSSSNNVTPSNGTTNKRKWLRLRNLLMSPTGRGLIINGGGSLSSATDPYGTPRPQGAGTDWGPVQSVKPTRRAVVSSEVVAQMVGRTQLVCALDVLDNTALQVSVEVQWSGGGGSKPQLVLLNRYGTAVQTVTATGAGTSWEVLTTTAVTPQVPGDGGGRMKVVIVNPDNANTVSWRRGPRRA